MKRLIILISITMTSNIGKGQIPNILWESSFGGTDWDQGNCVIQTPDDGFLVSGYTYSNDFDVLSTNGLADFWVIKLNSFGLLEWSKNYGGSGTDICYSISNCPDGYILAGGTNSIDEDVTESFGSFDYWVIKINLDGDIEWQKSYGGTEYDMAHDVLPTNDGGFILTGESKSIDGNITGHHGGSTSDFWVVKLDSIGSIVWERSLGNDDNGHGNALIQTVDGGYITVGPEIAPGQLEDFRIYKLTSAGDILWGLSFGGTDTDIPYDVLELSSHNIQLCGLTFSDDGDIDGFHGGCDTWIIQLDSLGSLQWQKTLGGDNFEAGYSLVEDNNQGAVVAGISESNNGDLTENYGFEDFWILKIDTIGNLVWQRNFGGSNFDEIFSISSLLGSVFVVAGHSRSSDIDVELNMGDFDVWVAKINVCDTKYYFDSDGDGFGNSEADSVSCEIPLGYVLDSTDCNDSDYSVNPGLLDLCNTIDDNCNALVDEDASSLTWYLDFDEDNYGNLFIDSISCFHPINFVADSTDCNDLDPNIYPGAIEILNGLDDDCDSQSDEGLTITENHADNISIYPNPSNGTVTIELSSPQAINMELRTLDGKLVNTILNVTEDKYTIDLSNEASGIYLLYIECREWTQTFPLVKE